MMEDKKQIRAGRRKERDSLLDGQARAWSDAVNEHLAGWELFQKARSICFYYPLGKEVDLLSAAGLALALGKEVYFPRTERLRMEFYQVTDLEHFKEGNFHVMEPEGGRRLEVFRVQESERDGERPPKGLLILVPGVAFDRQKQRLGYGKGYYDRYLSDIPEAVKAGIAYECQIAERLPAEEQDIPMDYVITEAGIW